MDNKKIQILGEPVNHHGSYTFYKSFKYLLNDGKYKTITISEFFFVKIWNDSDLVSIGELQLLWEDKNSEKILASLRLYFLPENTPDGRKEHGEDEVVAITEKVVLKVEDLVTWIIPGKVEWRWGHQAAWKDMGSPDSTTNEPQEGDTAEQSSQAAVPNVKCEVKKGKSDELTQSVVVLSFPRYCRYRSIARRLEGAKDHWLHSALVTALGGVLGVNKATRVLFCKETFDYPDLEDHELLCNHLAPKLAGRPRKKRKKRSSSPGSESNESVSSNFSATSSPGKLTRNAARQAANSTTTVIIARTSSSAIPRTARMGGARVTSSNQGGSREEQEFLRGLYVYMEKQKSPIDRIPSLGFKQIDLFAFYKKVRSMGGYQQVTTRKLWKRVYDEMGGSQSNTSAATCTRKHYERLLLPYERQLIVENKQKRKDHKVDHLKSQLPVKQEEDPDEPVIIQEISQSSPERRKSCEESPTLKKRKLEILQQGGLEVTPIGQQQQQTPQQHVPIAAPQTTSTPHRRNSVIQGSTPPNIPSQVSITVTPDVTHMLGNENFKVPPPQRVTQHMFSRTGRVYGNPKLDVASEKQRPDLEVLDLTIKPASSKLKTSLPPDLSIYPQNGHKQQQQQLQLQPPSKIKLPNSSLEITLVNNSQQQQQQQNGTLTKNNHHYHQHKTQKSTASSTSSHHHHHHQLPSNINPYNLPSNLPFYSDPTLYYQALFGPHIYRQNQLSMLPGFTGSPDDLYKSLMSHHASLASLACLNQSYPGLPKDGSTSITPLPRPNHK